MSSSDCDNKRLTTKNSLWWSPLLLSAIIYYHQIIWPHTQSQLQIIFCACLVSDHETTHIHYICVCCKIKAQIMGWAWICMPSKCFCALVKMFEEWSTSRWHMWLKLDQVYCAWLHKGLLCLYKLNRLRFGRVDTDAWHLTHRQTTEYRATQLVYNIKFKLSHAISSTTAWTALYCPGARLFGLQEHFKCWDGWWIFFWGWWL